MPRSRPYSAAPATTYRGRLAVRVVTALACVAQAVPAPAAGRQAEPGEPTGTCLFLEGTRNLNAITLAGGDRISYVSSPRIACDDGVRIEADSAVTYSSQNLTYLFGHVRYVDRDRELRSDEARYFSRQGRLQATGNVYVQDSRRGSTIEHGELVYLRRTEFRETEQMDVTVGPDPRRPHAVLYIRPAGHDSVEVVAAVPEVEASDSSGAAAGDDAAAAVTDSAPAPAAPVDSLSLPAVPPDDSVATRPAAPDEAGAPPPPLSLAPSPAAEPDTTARAYDVVADRIFLEGEGFFLATGHVEIVRDSLRAFGDSAEYDRAAQRMVLQGGARVRRGEYDLHGRTVHLAMPGGDVRSVRAVREGVLVGEDLRLTGPLIHLFLADGEVERLVATPLREDSAEADPDSSALERPVAIAERFTLTGDSLDARVPGGALDRIYAVGAARGESSARDSLNVESLPETARRDWISGDTVVVAFEPAPADTTALPAGSPPPAPGEERREYVVDRLVAAGRARSLYRMAPSDTLARPGVDPPAVHYVTGTRITIDMVSGEVDAMEVEGESQGWHLEPLGRRASPDSLAPDSLVTDSAAVPGRPAVPDTSRAERREGSSSTDAARAVARERLGRGSGSLAGSPGPVPAADFRGRSAPARRRR